MDRKQTNKQVEIHPIVMYDLKLGIKRLSLLLRGVTVPRIRIAGIKVCRLRVGVPGSPSQVHRIERKEVIRVAVRCANDSCRAGHKEDGRRCDGQGWHVRA